LENKATCGKNVTENDRREENGRMQLAHAEADAWTTSKATKAKRSL